MAAVQNTTSVPVPDMQQHCWGMDSKPLVKSSKQLLLVRSIATAGPIAAAKLAFETSLSDIGLVHKPDADMGIFCKQNEDMVAPAATLWIHDSADCTGERRNGVWKREPLMRGVLQVRMT